MSKTTQDMSAKTSTMADTTTHLAATNDSVLTKIGETNTTAKETEAAVKHSDATVQQSTNAVLQSNVISSKIAAVAQAGYTDGRQGSTYDIRRKSLNEMDKAPSMDEKIFQAGVFFSAMEYQLWKGPEDPTDLNGLYDCAIVQFVRTLADYLPADLTKINVTSTDPKMMDLYALATGAQEMNKNALPTTVSFLDLLKQIVLLKSDVDSGKKDEKTDLKDWQRDGLDKYRQIVYYLQVRENFLPVMALGEIKPELAQLSLLGDISKIETKVKEIIGAGWHADFNSLNQEQIVTYTKWINEANTTAVFLKTAGEETLVDRGVQGLLASMKIDYTPQHNTEAVRTPAIESFKSAAEGFASIQ